MKTFKLILSLLITLFIFAKCEKEDSEPYIHNPDEAMKVNVDRFSENFGTLFVRSSENNFPGPNEPIDFDQIPFITQGIGPNGEIVKYYNFDVLPVQSAPIFVLFKESEDMPVKGQLNIIDVIPGDDHYNDFWHVHKVTVPDNYVANTIASLDDLIATGYLIERTNIIVNCPVVPKGSIADLRFTSEEPTGLIRGWYKNQIVFYFTFEEKKLTVEIPAEGHPDVPLSDILVTFNINPDQEGGGPPSGFVTEPGTEQTHNVPETLPTDEDYSPLWDVDVYDNADFDNVSDWMSAQNANILGEGVALVNCPIVSVE